MFAKTTAFLALFAVATRVAVAVPPACLVAAVNTQSDPSAISTVCKDGLSDVEDYITKNCGDAADAAMSALQSVCKDAGVTVSSSSSSSSSSSDDSSSTSSSATSSSDTSSSAGSSTSTNTGGSTGFTTSTASAGSAGSASAGSATPTSTGGTGSNGGGSGSNADASPSTSPSNTPNTNMAARLGMDVVGMVALGVFGAMLAL